MRHFIQSFQSEQEAKFRTEVVILKGMYEYAGFNAGIYIACILIYFRRQYQLERQRPSRPLACVVLWSSGNHNQPPSIGDVSMFYDCWDEWVKSKQNAHQHNYRMRETVMQGSFTQLKIRLILTEHIRSRKSRLNNHIHIISHWGTLMAVGLLDEAKFEASKWGVNARVSLNSRSE